MEQRIRDGEFDNKLAYLDDRGAYRYEDQRLRVVFAEEALKNVGLENYPLKDKVFEKAWSDGHSSGYMHVYYELVELAEMIAPTSSLFAAVVNVLTVEEDEIADANYNLLHTAIDIGLVKEEDCNFG